MIDVQNVRDTISKAAELRLVALLLERPKPGRREQVAALAREVEDPALRSLAKRLGDLDEATYVSLFGPGGPVSPREVAYRKMEDPGWIMADAAAFYAAFGYRPDAEDPVDHMSVVVGFAAYMGLKEVYARSTGGDAELPAEARARFVETHLGPLAAGLSARLEIVEAPDLLELARWLAHRVGAKPLPPPGDPVVDDEGTFSCGPCGGDGARPAPSR